MKVLLNPAGEDLLVSDRIEDSYWKMTGRSCRHWGRYDLCDIRSDPRFIDLCVQYAEDFDQSYEDPVVVDIPDEASDFVIVSCECCERLFYVLDGRIVDTVNSYGVWTVPTTYICGEKANYVWGKEEEE